ncbi:MAG: 50S ribosomal protein L9 [Kistimonas sp.]|nr:50S ribosomal protein L9 [Kistimonas sp.]
MEVSVILQEKIYKLGNLGDMVQVAAGYARNCLIPSGLAVQANEKNMKEFEARRALLEKAASEKLASARQRAERLNEMELTITAKAGEEGKLFGSIGNRDLAESISAVGVEVARDEIRLPQGPIRATGEFDISLHLHSDVSATVKVFVEAE